MFFSVLVGTPTNSAKTPKVSSATSQQLAGANSTAAQTSNNSGEAEIEKQLNTLPCNSDFSKVEDNQFEIEIEKVPSLHNTGINSIKTCKYRKYVMIFSQDFETWLVRNINILKAQQRQIQETLDTLLGLATSGGGAPESLAIKKSEIPKGLFPIKDDVGQDEAKVWIDKDESHRLSLVNNMSICHSILITLLVV